MLAVIRNDYQEPRVHFHGTFPHFVNFRVIILNPGKCPVFQKTSFTMLQDGIWSD